jgi:hypothetical protein
MIARRTNFGIGNSFRRNSMDLKVMEPGEEANDAGQELSVSARRLKLFQIFGGNPLCRTLRMRDHFSRLVIFPCLIGIECQHRIRTGRVGMTQTMQRKIVQRGSP